MICRDHVRERRNKYCICTRAKRLSFGYDGGTKWQAKCHAVSSIASVDQMCSLFDLRDFPPFFGARMILDYITYIYI